MYEKVEQLIQLNISQASLDELYNLDIMLLPVYLA